MLVPFELSIIANRHGRLTPSLAIGWKIGNYLREFFNGLDQVRLAVGRNDDTHTALKHMRTESRFPLDLLPPDRGRPWDVLAYHPITGTVLEISFIVPEEDVPEADPDASYDTLALAMFKTSLDHFVAGLISTPLDHYCNIIETRVARSHAGRGTVSCRRCGKTVEGEDLWHINGLPCCQDCSGMPESWVGAN